MGKFFVTAVFAATCLAMQAASSAGLYPNSFEKPATAALKALNATTGKPFKAGYVFVDGRYVNPPYTVQRYGNVIRINNIQVTGEIVPWSEFVKTQEGATATKTESAPTPEPEVAPPEPEVESEAEDVLDDDSETTLDDLFDDDPAPKKKAAPKKRVPRRPKAVKPASTVTYSFDGTFKHNPTTLAYVKKINEERKKIDLVLRKGGYCFFGSKYPAVSGNASMAKYVFSKMLPAMKNATNPDMFGNYLRNGGLSYLPVALMNDLYANRNMTQIMVARRLKADKEAAEWSQLLDNGL